MERKELLKSPEYWTAGIQIMLYNCAENFMEATGKNRTQLAEHLGVSKGYVSQLLNGDYDHKLSKLVELSLAFGYVPKVDFIPVDDYVEHDSFMKNKRELYNSNYKAIIHDMTSMSYLEDYEVGKVNDLDNAA